MATVHFGRMTSLGGFSRTVAIKRMRRDIAMDPEFVAMFLDEARLTSRVEHPNVVATLDVVAEGGEVFLVMEYVRGESLSRLIRACRHSDERVPIPTAINIIGGGLNGLHAAHEALGEGGAPLGIIHRDVSPQNILVGEDGVTRITDFGIAKAESRAQVTRDGMMKGKLCYMAPEQLSRAGRLLDRRVDIFACGVVAWELISGKKLFMADHPGETMANVLNAPVPPLTGIRDDVTVAIDRVIRKALARNPDQRWKSAEEFALGLEEAMPNIASNRVVGAWVSKIAGDVLAGRTKYVREIESIGGLSGTPISQVKLTPPEESSAPKANPTAGTSDQPAGSAAISRPSPAHQPASLGRGGLAAPRVPRITAQQGPAAGPSANLTPPPAHQEQPSAPSIGSLDSAPIPGPAPAPLPAPIAGPLSPYPAQTSSPAQYPGGATQDRTSAPVQGSPPQPMDLEPTLEQKFSPEALASLNARIQVEAASAFGAHKAAEPFVPIAPFPASCPPTAVELFTSPGPFPASAPPATAEAFSPPAVPSLVVPAPNGQPSASAWQPPADAPPPEKPLPVAVEPIASDLDYEPPPKLASRLFSTPGRTAAVYVGAIALLGLSIALFIFASRSSRSSDSTPDKPIPSQTIPVATSPSVAVEPTSTSPAATSTGAITTDPTPTASPSAPPSGKNADKSKPVLVPYPVGPRPPGKGTQPYIPDRP
jgi:serine/threonine-protein kinase